MAIASIAENHERWRSQCKQLLTPLQDAHKVFGKISIEVPKCDEFLKNNQLTREEGLKLPDTLSVNISTVT